MTSKEQHPGKVLVIAGTGPGLGAALVETFLEAGYQVAGLSRSAPSGNQGRAPARNTLRGFRHYPCDVTRNDEVLPCINAIRTDLGTPTVVVYNPMRLVIKPFLDVSIDEFEGAWRVTCLGAVIVAQAVLPLMLGAGGGTLVFSGATASTRGSATFAPLAIAKFGVRGLAQSLAREFGPAGIHVIHTLIDGLIWAPQTVARFHPDPASCIDPTAIAQAYLQLAGQHRSAWTHELDLRPADGRF